MFLRLRWLIVACVFLTALFQPARWLFSSFGHRQGQTGYDSYSIEFLRPDLRLRSVCETPERISALLTYANDSYASDQVLIGTASTGRVYGYDPEFPELLMLFAAGLGDEAESGTCEVSSLMIGDFHGDGQKDLLAATSQVSPRGRPRIYAWSLSDQTIRRPILIGMARPEIESSWGHGLALLKRPQSGEPSLFSTFCGHGEVLEFQGRHDSTASGFKTQGLSWRQVNMLPASGEQAVAADADNDGQPDLCLATGFSRGNAAVLIYRFGENGVDSKPRHRIDERGRFGNVRFLVGDARGDGQQDLIAWWCTDLSNGQCTMIRYRFDPRGQRQRTQITWGQAEALWPLEGQMSLTDFDQDGHPEVWFATSSGYLWCYDPSKRPALSLVGQFHGKFGPIAAARIGLDRHPCLFIGCDRQLLCLERSNQTTVAAISK